MKQKIYIFPGKIFAQGGKMNSVNLSKKRGERSVLLLTCFIASAVFLLTTSSFLFAAQPVKKSFSSPEEAVKSLVAAVRAHDLEEMLAILGPGSKELISSGDNAADRTGREKFLKAYDQMNTLQQDIAGQNDALYRHRQLAHAHPDREEGIIMGV